MDDLTCVDCRLPIARALLDGEPVCEHCVKARADEEADLFHRLSHNTNQIRGCEYCGVMLLPDHIAVYCSNECARADA